MTSCFVYDLPKEKIAARPVRPYDRAKLLNVGRETGEIAQCVFSGLPALLEKNSVLVFNNTGVNKARLFGKLSGSDREAEFLLLKKEDPASWQCMARPIRKLMPGARVEFAGGLTAEIGERLSEKVIRLNFLSENGALSSAIEKAAVMPIPPYIREGRADDEDAKDYQSMFAERPGSIAAPTASLHFTPDLLKELRENGISTEFITLHIGAPSIQALWDGDEPGAINPPGVESYLFDSALKQRITRYKQEGKPVIAVGTSVVRALESMANSSHEDRDLISTDLFIRPGFEFKMTGGLITNFHMPASTHLLLVEAFMGSALLKESYEFALNSDFRFLSYGDGMLIV